MSLCTPWGVTDCGQPQKGETEGKGEDTGDREQFRESYRKRNLWPPAVHEIVLCWWLHPKESSQVLSSFLAGSWIKHPNLFFLQIVHTPVLAIFVQVYVAYCKQATSGLKPPSFTHSSQREKGRGNKVKDLGRAQSTLLVLLLVPVRLWKITPTFYYASKFSVLIDDAFTRSKFLSTVHHKVLSRMERGVKNQRKTMRKMFFWPHCVWGSGCVLWETCMCKCERHTRQGETLPQGSLWRAPLVASNPKTVMESYFWIWISTPQDHHCNTSE